MQISLTDLDILLRKTSVFFWEHFFLGLFLEGDMVPLLHLSVLLSYQIVIYTSGESSLDFIRYLLNLLCVLLGLMLDDLGFVWCLAGSIWIVWGHRRASSFCNGQKTSLDLCFCGLSIIRIILPGKWNKQTKKNIFLQNKSVNIITQ